MFRYTPYLVVLIAGVILTSCFSEPKKLAEMEEYDGPAVESTDVRMLVSDSAVIKLKIEGARSLQHQNGDLEFPEGMHVTIYDRFGEPVSELTAQYGYKNAKENIYKATGDVLVLNLKKKETLSTEELFWDQDEAIIYTEKFVTIETEDNIIPGEGLVAPQDLSTYEIKKPRDAIIKIDDTDEVNN